MANLMEITEDEVPVRVVLAHFVQFYFEVTCYTGGQNLAAESGHPHNVILRLVHCMSLSVQFHSYIISQRRWTWLSPPASRAGNSRWIRIVSSDDNRERLTRRLPLTTAYALAPWHHIIGFRAPTPTLVIPSSGSSRQPRLHIGRKNKGRQP